MSVSVWLKSNWLLLNQYVDISRPCPRYKENYNDQQITGWNFRFYKEIRPNLENKETSSSNYHRTTWADIKMKHWIFSSYLSKFLVNNSQCNVLRYNIKKQYHNSLRLRLNANTKVNTDEHKNRTRRLLGVFFLVPWSQKNNLEAVFATIWESQRWKMAADKTRGNC